MCLGPFVCIDFYIWCCALRKLLVRWCRNKHRCYGFKLHKSLTCYGRLDLYHTLTGTANYKNVNRDHKHCDISHWTGKAQTINSVMSVYVLFFYCYKISFNFFPCFLFLFSFPFSFFSLFFSLFFCLQDIGLSLLSIKVVKL